MAKYGFNFEIPDESKLRYTKEHPYVSTGEGRVNKKGKEYVGIDGDVAEFNDLYLKDFGYDGVMGHNFMGLDIDEVVDSTINFSRKNYCDFFPDKPYPEDIKMVGNTIKSKKMPEYIAKFLDKGIRLLIRDKGQEFLNEYYSYVSKIYNYQIPLKQIASKGKVKKYINEYISDCNTLTKSGQKKSRQAWMELAIKDNLNVEMGETLYYINTGSKKSESDVKRVTHYYVPDEDLLEEKKKDIRTKLQKEYKEKFKLENGKLPPASERPSLEEWVRENHKEVTIEDEIILNCKLLPRNVVESEVDVYCEDGEEYNVPKYLEMFNKRITPLLVCFSKDIRDRILITNPSDRPYFTDEETKLCSGQPNKEGDQDTYEQLMTMEDKEIRFWMKHPEWEIPFIKECGMDWEQIKNDYLERLRREKELGVDKIREKYEEIISKMNKDDFDDFEEGKIPDSLLKIIEIDPATNNFMCKEYPDVVIGTIYDIFDAQEAFIENVNAEYSSFI